MFLHSHHLAPLLPNWNSVQFNTNTPPSPAQQPPLHFLSPWMCPLYGPDRSRIKSVCLFLSGLLLSASCPSLGQVVACVRLWSVSLRWLAMPSNFLCTYWLFVYLLWRNFYSGPLHIFKRCCFLLLLSYIFSVLIPYPMHDLQIFSPIPWGTFLLLIVSLGAQMPSV